jgi:glycerate-2-kinase
MDDRAKAKIVRLPYGEKHLVSEAKDVGLVLASIAREIENKKRPSVSVAGGETTVSISGEHGEGGRNQELAMAAALKIGAARRSLSRLLALMGVMDRLTSQVPSLTDIS